MSVPKFIDSVETDAFCLEVYECPGCEFHMGLDTTYLELVDDINYACPSCGEALEIERF